MSYISRAFILLLAILGSGCTTAPYAVELNDSTCPPTKCAAVATGYSLTYFEDRYMGRTIGREIGMQFGLIGALLGELSTSDRYAKESATRLDANEFEKGLGDFDTKQYVLHRLSERFGESKRLQVTFAKDAETSKAILDGIKTENPTQATVLNTSTGATHELVGAFRVSYGLAMRVGAEQFGFRKIYRPFIRLNGIVKNLRTGTIVWRNSVLAFGDKGYKGDEADANRVDPVELKLAFQKLAPEVVDLTIRSLNGEQLPPMPLLDATNDADLKF